MFDAGCESQNSRPKPLDVASVRIIRFSSMLVSMWIFSRNESTDEPWGTPSDILTCFGVFVSYSTLTVTGCIDS